MRYALDPFLLLGKEYYYKDFINKCQENHFVCCAEFRTRALCAATYSNRKIRPTVLNSEADAALDHQIQNFLSPDILVSPIMNPQNSSPHFFSEKRSLLKVVYS